MIFALAEKTFSVEIGPTLAAAMASFIAAVGAWGTAWLAFRKSQSNDVKRAETDKTVEQIHTAVNSTAKALAEKLSATEAALLDVTRRLADAESKLAYVSPTEPKTPTP